MIVTNSPCSTENETPFKALTVSLPIWNSRFRFCISRIFSGIFFNFSNQLILSCLSGWWARTTAFLPVIISSLSCRQKRTFIRCLFLYFSFCQQLVTHNNFIIRIQSRYYLYFRFIIQACYNSPGDKRTIFFDPDCCVLFPVFLQRFIVFRCACSESLFSRRLAVSVLSSFLFRVPQVFL